MLSTSSYFFNRKDISRILNLLLSYFISASILISALYIFNTNENLSNPENLTNFILIISIAAGIEFGFTKSYLVKSNKEDIVFFNIDGIFKIVFLRCIIPSLVILLFFIFLDIKIGLLQKALFSYLICFISLTTNELRVVSDSYNLHSRAIWIKQGGFSLGIIFFLLGLIFNIGISLSFLAYISIRILWIFLNYYKFKKLSSNKENIVSLRKENTLGWIHFFGLSLLAVLSGNIDRILISTFLQSNEVLVYFLIYEIFSKYWLICIIINPILFVKNTNKNTRLQINIVLKLVFCLSLFILFICFILINLFPNFLAINMNINVDVFDILLFFVSIIINTHTQLLGTFLQSKGFSNDIFKINLFVTIATILMFSVGLIKYGLEGLLIAWLAKSILEGLLFVSLFKSRIYLNNGN